MTDTRPLPAVRKIAVLRANGIGDYLFIVPALEALRVAYPAAQIVLLGKPWHASFLTERPGPVDRVVVIPRCEGVGEPEGYENDEAQLDSFFEAMRGERFDLALQLHGGGRFSNPFVQQLGAAVTAGLQSDDAPPLDRCLRYVYFQLEIARYLEVVSLVGARPVTLEPRICLTEADRKEAAEVVREGEGRWAALHVGATDPQRRWPAERFAEVGDALAADGYRIAVTGSGDERLAVDAVLEGMSFPAVNLADRLSLGGLTAFLARCSVVISNDSGPMHLAHAAGTPTVGLYIWFNMITAGIPLTARFRPLISWRTTCPVCGADRVGGSCPHRPSFIADITVEQVLQAARDLLRLHAG